MRSGVRRRQPPAVAGRREGRGERPPPAPEPGVQGKGLSRRDLLVAGIGVAAGVVTTGITTVALDRVGPAVASSNLEAFPTIDWSPDGSWLFYAEEPIDLSDQPDRFGPPDGSVAPEAIDYLVTRGCVRASPLVVNLHLSRPGNAPAVVRDIRLVNHRRGSALTGASYLSETAGSNDNTVLAVDLDANPPVPVESDLSEVLYGGDVSGRASAFSTSTFSVEPHLTETLTIGFLTQSGRHSFQLGIDYFVEGREHSIVVPDDVDLLRVTENAEAREQYELPWYENVHHYVRRA